MSDEGDQQDDKTELPTEKKLQEARERGDVAVSREAPLFAGLLATLLVCSLFVRDGAMRMAGGGGGPPGAPPPPPAGAPPPRPRPCCRA